MQNKKNLLFIVKIIHVSGVWKQDRYVFGYDLLNYGFCKKLLLYEWTSEQLNTFFIKIRFALSPQSNFDEKSVQLLRSSFVKK